MLPVTASRPGKDWIAPPIGSALSARSAGDGRGGR
jgi:hypothetical protein